MVSLPPDIRQTALWILDLVLLKLIFCNWSNSSTYPTCISQNLVDFSYRFAIRVFVPPPGDCDHSHRLLVPAHALVCWRFRQLLVSLMIFFPIFSSFLVLPSVLWNSFSVRSVLSQRGWGGTPCFGTAWVLLSSSRPSTWVSSIHNLVYIYSQTHLVSSVMTYHSFFSDTEERKALFQRAGLETSHLVLNLCVLAGVHVFFFIVSYLLLYYRTRQVVS